MSDSPATDHSPTHDSPAGRRPADPGPADAGPAQPSPRPVRDQEHAQSFARDAGGYDAHRPGYPDATVRWLLDDARDVVDAGAGTGKLAAALAAHGARVTAVDPLPEMLAVLRENIPGVTALEGTGEDLPVPSGSADLVTFAQAWHWVDPERATAEALRVLLPGGRLGLVWNTRDESVPWVAELSAAMHRGLHEAQAFEPTLGAGLELVATREERWVQPLDRAGLLALATTRSYYLTLDDAGRAAMLDRVAAVLDAHADEVAAGLPYVTQAWVATRPAR